MRRLFPFLSAGVLLATIAAPTFAQQRLFAAGPSGIVELDPRAGSVGTILRRFATAVPEDPRGGGIVSMAGGAFLVWPDGGSVALLDTRSGAVQRFSFPDFQPLRVVGTDGNFRLVVTGVNRGYQHGVVLVADARTGSIRRIDLGPGRRPELIAYAPGRDLLFAGKPREVNAFGGFDFADVEVYDAGTGALLKTLDLSSARATSLAVNTAGTRLFVPSYPLGIYAVDTQSGAIVASSNEQRPWSTLILDEARHRLFGVFDGLEAFSMDSLQSIGRSSAPKLRIPDPPGIESPRLKTDVAVSPVSATIFAFEGGYVNYNYYPGTCQQVNLVAINAATGEERTVVDLMAKAINDCFLRLVRITEPLAPAAFTATTSGRRVTLTWTPPVGATRYEIEAGAAPGQGGVVLPTSDSTLVVDNVPPGTYYVRVRAINTIGKSSPSQEVQLIVQ